MYIHHSTDHLDRPLTAESNRMTQIKALLIGLGQIGCRYDLNQPFQINHALSGPVTWTHARAIACHPEVDLIGAVDPSAKARMDFNAVYPYPTFTDIEAFIQTSGDKSIDLAIVAVPPALQPMLVERLLAQCSPRMLLLEKPVAINVQEAEILLQACTRQPNLVVAVNYIRRYLPVVLQLQSQLHVGGPFGELLHGRLVYGKGLLSNGSHFVNLAEAWLGSLCPKSIWDQGPTYAGFDQEACLTLTAAGHHHARLHLESIGRTGLRAGELDLWFTQGRLLWANDGGSVKCWRLDEAAVGDSHRPLMAEPEVLPSGMEHYQHYVLDNLVRHSQQPAAIPIHCDLNAGLETLQLLESALNACR